MYKQVVTCLLIVLLAGVTVEVVHAHKKIPTSSEILTWAGHTASRDGLIRALEDRRAFVREHAVVLLGEVEQSELTKPDFESISARLTDQHVRVRLAAAVALARHNNVSGLEAVGVVISDGEKWTDVLVAVRALRPFAERANTFDMLKSALQHDHRYVRMAAVEEIARLDHADVDATLQVMTGDAAFVVSSAADRAIAARVEAANRKSGNR